MGLNWKIYSQDLRKNHFERRIPELLSKVIIQQAMFELIHRAACFSRQVFESDPHE